MRITADPTRTMSGGGSGNFLLVPIPEYPVLDCVVPNKNVKIVVLGASNVGKTGKTMGFYNLLDKLN
jgi:Ras-like protein family protein 11A